MTIFTDAVGNAYFGDCIYANHNVIYPTVKYLQATPIQDLISELTTVLNNSGLQYRNVATQTAITNAFNSGGNFFGTLFHFGANTDTINDRYAIGLKCNDTGGTSSFAPSMLYNNSGSTNIANSSSDSTNQLALSSFPALSYSTGGFTNLSELRNTGATTLGLTTVCGVANSNSFAMFMTKRNFNFGGNSNYNRNFFVYAGILEDINTGFNYYSASNITKSILIAGGNDTDGLGLPQLRIRHYIAGTAKWTLETGDAQYAIVCADGQNPTSQWATDMYLFDNNTTLGFPAMGRVSNLLLATGSYTLGKPVKIQGTAMPDAGFNRWLPVGTYAGKTVLMRCYSSVDI